MTKRERERAELHPGDVIDNRQLCAIFKCSPQGGMRRSHRTNTLVIISDYVKSIYGNRWLGDICYYVGMGLRGDQNLGFMQNKTLYESNKNGVKVHLFEVFVAGEYTYKGEVRLVGEPFEEIQPDADGKQRLVWVFPLQTIDVDGVPAIPKEIMPRKSKNIPKNIKDKHWKSSANI